MWDTCSYSGQQLRGIMVRTKDGGLGPAPAPHRREDAEWDFHAYLSARAKRAVIRLQYERRQADPPIEQTIHDILDEAVIREAGGGLGPEEYNALNVAQATLARGGIDVDRVDVLRTCLWYSLDHLVAQALSGEPVFQRRQKEA